MGLGVEMGGRNLVGRMVDGECGGWWWWWWRRRRIGVRRIRGGDRECAL